MAGPWTSGFIATGRNEIGLYPGGKAGFFGDNVLRDEFVVTLPDGNDDGDFLDDPLPIG